MNTADRVDPDTIELHALGLRPGVMLKARPLGQPRVELELQFLAILESKGVLVEPRGLQALKAGLQAGTELQVQGFTGRHDFSFVAKVNRVFDFTFREPPLAYALLAYPESVEVRQVRSAARVAVDLPAEALPGGEDRRIPVVIRNLSITGALLESDEPPGVQGGELVLRVRVGVDGDAIEAVLPAVVTRVERSPANTAMTGVLFQNILCTDKLALHYLVHRAG
jgi:hypothetical protein